MLYTCRLIYIELYNRVNLIPAIIINCMCAVQGTHNTCMQHACKISQIHAYYMYQHACYLVLCACNMLVTCTTFAQSLTTFHSILYGEAFCKIIIAPQIHACHMCQHACYLLLCACNMHVNAQSRRFTRLYNSMLLVCMYMICSKHVISCSVHVTCLLHTQHFVQGLTLFHNVLYVCAPVHSEINNLLFF